MRLSCLALHTSQHTHNQHDQMAIIHPAGACIGGGVGELHGNVGPHPCRRWVCGEVVCVCLFSRTSYKTCSCTHQQTRACSRSHTRTHTHTFTHFHALTHARARTHARAHTVLRTFKNPKFDWVYETTRTHTLSHTLTHTHTHTLTHTVLRTFKNPKFDWVYETTPEKHCQVGTTKTYCLY